MSAKVIPIEDWLASFREAAGEVAASTLRLDGAAMPQDKTGKRPGAFIAVQTDRHAIHLGLSSSAEGCRALARGFLGLRADQPIEEQDVADGIREVMNIVAGKVKSKMAGKDGPLRLGLPMFLTNPAHAGEGQETASTDLKLGTVDCKLFVYRSQHAA